MWITLQTSVTKLKNNFPVNDRQIRIAQFSFKTLSKFEKTARKPGAFKRTVQLCPELGVGNPAKPRSPKESLAFGEASFISSISKSGFGTCLYLSVANSPKNDAGQGISEIKKECGTESRLLKYG